jgi:uncharacterized protein YdaU (DUF1376 family)
MQAMQLKEGCQGMNHYPHHINDFNNATRHLTRTERSIYSDMIDMYYDTEAPLTLDVDVLKRKLLARTKEEKEAVDSILSEFFIRTDGGWFNSRCDEVLTDYFGNTSQKSVAGKASAAKRKENKEKRLKELNGITTDVEQKSTDVEQPLNYVATEINGTPTNHKPRTINQEPEPEKQTDPVDHVSVKAAKFDFKKYFLENGCNHNHLEDWMKARKLKKAVNTETAQTKIINQMQLAKLSVFDLVRICAEKSWSGFSADWDWRDVVSVSNPNVKAWDFDAYLEKPEIRTIHDEGAIKCLK